jgi:hypothetical protein
MYYRHSCIMHDPLFWLNTHCRKLENNSMKKIKITHKPILKNYLPSLPCFWDFVFAFTPFFHEPCNFLLCFWFYGSTGVWTQGLALARQMLYSATWAMSPVLQSLYLYLDQMWKSVFGFWIAFPLPFQLNNVLPGKANQLETLKNTFFFLKYWDLNLGPHAC